MTWSSPSGPTAGVPKSALSNPDYVSVRDGELVVTRIMDWYGSDFVDPDYKGSAATLPAFIERYASDDVASFLDERGADVPVRFMDYEWGLNKP